MGNRADFLGVPVDLIDLEETIRRAEEAMRLRWRLQRVALHVAKFCLYAKNQELRDDVLTTDWAGVAISHHARAAQDVEAVPHDKNGFCRYYRQGGVPALIILHSNMKVAGWS